MSYVELHAHSAYSFLDGASMPGELAAVAAEQGYEALALTDHDAVHGAMELAHEAPALGVRPIAGAEVTLDDGSHVTLLCEDERGWRNLCRILTRAHEGTRAWERGEAGDRLLPPSVPLAEVERRAAGLVCLSGCARAGALAARVERGDHAGAAALGRRLLAAFGRDGLRVELQRPFARRDRRRNRLLAQLAERLGVPCVATGNVHAHERARVPLQDAFVAVRLRRTLDETEPARRGNSSHVLAPPDAMAERFRDHPDAVLETERLAERLRFDLRRGLAYRYPGSEDAGADRELAELCRARLDERYAGRALRAEALARLEEELRVIAHLGLAGFFLLHRDLLELAREVAYEVRGPSAARAVLPPGRGRGSSVSSIVCYLTGLSHVDPVENRLALGRFLNEELSALPDIDLDFPRDVRELLIPRVVERYGRDRAALVASFACYRSRGAIRDLGKALGLPPGEVERVARAAEPWRPDGLEGEVEEAIGARRAASPRWRWLVRLVKDAYDLPRHASQHPGGMVIATQPLCEVCPIQPAAMSGRQVLQWDKDSCGDAGFLKIDLLGLGMLSAVERCVDEIARVRGETIDLSRIPYDDPEVYAAIQRAETTGVFQIESRAQMQMLVRTRPESLDDLTVQVALVRPGPIQGGAVHPYIERRKRLRADPSYEVPYEHPSLEPCLRDTLGAIVFQDQVIEASMAFAGFSPGEAEGLRRAMSRKRSEAAMRAYREKFVAGAIARHGVSRELAERVYGQIEGFSGFGFPKSHSAAFGLLAYQSTWLRVHYGPELLCALLNEQPMGFYPPDHLAHEARRRGIEVLPPCVARSEVLCRVETVAGSGAVAAGPVSDTAPSMLAGGCARKVSVSSPPAGGASEALAPDGHGLPRTAHRSAADAVGHEYRGQLHSHGPGAVAPAAPSRAERAAAGTPPDHAPPAGGDDEDAFRAQRSEHGRRLIGDRTRGLAAGSEGAGSEGARGEGAGGEGAGSEGARGEGAGGEPTPAPAAPGPGHLAVRIGLGYVAGIKAADAHAIVEERERSGPFRSAADLAARCAARSETLELLAWAGACDALCPGGRREALWLLGVAAPGVPAGAGVQLALPLDAEAPELRELTAWERLVADYGSTKMTLREHPLELLRPSLGEGVRSSADLARTRHGTRVRVAGMVIARQRPATAKGVTFMLLEDEHGTINLIVPVQVYERCRLAVRGEPLVTADGRLERREGVVNVVVDRVARLERPDLPRATVRHIEPRVAWSSRAADPDAHEEADALDDVRAVAPAGHSFGRRG